MPQQKTIRYLPPTQYITNSEKGSPKEKTSQKKLNKLSLRPKIACDINLKINGFRLLPF